MARITAIQAFKKTRRRADESNMRRNKPSQTLIHSKGVSRKKEGNSIQQVPPQIIAPIPSSFLARYKRQSPESIAFASSSHVRWPRPGITSSSRSPRSKTDKLASQHKITEYFKVIPKCQAKFESSLEGKQVVPAISPDPGPKPKIPLSTTTNTCGTEPGKINLFPGVYLVDKMDSCDGRAGKLREESVKLTRDQNITIINIDDSIDLVDQFRSNFKAFGIGCDNDPSSPSSMEIQHSELSQKQTLSQISAKPGLSQSSLGSDYYLSRDLEDEVEVIEVLPPIPMRDHPVHEIE